MIDLDKIDNDWSSPIVARSEMEKFTQGLYKPLSFRTFDGRKEGIKRKIKLNNKIAYFKSDVIEWLKFKLKIRKEKLNDE